MDHEATSIAEPAQAATDARWWAPTIVIVPLLLAGSLGLLPDLTARAANPETVDVTGAVDKDVQLDVTGCSGSDLSIGAIVPDDPWVQTTTTCDIAFGSNNSAMGADLQVMEDPAAGPGPTMKCIATCGADSIADLPAPAGGPPAAPASAFGIGLDSAGGAAVGIWPVAPAVQPVADAPDTACQTASTASGTCSFRFGAMAAAGSDAPGSYQGQVRMLVLAR